MNVRLAALLLAPLALPAWGARPASPPSLYRPGEVIVKYRDGADSSAAQQLRARLGLVSAQRLLDGRAERLQLPSVMDVRGALAVLAKDAAVEYAEPNYLRRKLSAVPNDPSFSAQWGLQNTGQANFVAGGPAGTPGGDMHMPQAWDSNNDGTADRTGTGAVTVAIVDDGFELSHPDLAANFIAGYDFKKNDSNPAPDSSADSHGTEVAGALGAIGNNGVGVAGPIWKLKMMPLRFGYDTGSEISALQYAQTNGAQIVNLSFGSATYSQAESDAIAALANAGILVFAAAGNQSGNLDTSGASYPANYQLANLMPVAATNRQDDVASFSSYGAVNVPVAAPGLQIVTTSLNASYTTSGVSGTSFSAPYAAGVAALVKDYTPSANYLELRSRLIEGADPGLDSSEPVDRRTAGGRINAATTLSLSARPALVIKPQQVGSYTSSDSGTQTSVPILAPVKIGNDSNGNGVLDPGDTATLTVQLQNLWQTASLVTGTLSADNGVTVSGGATAFGTLAQLGTASGSFTVTVPTSATGHRYVNFTLQLSANGGLYTATRHFTLELGTLANATTVTQGIGNGLYDNYQTWHYTLSALPAGQDTLSFQTTANNDIDILVSYGTPPQYSIDLAQPPSASDALYYVNIPDAQIGGAAGGNEYVNIKNPPLGTYYVTVVNYDKTSSASYTLTASTNSGGVGCAVSSTYSCGSSSGGGGAAGAGTLAGLLTLAALRRRRGARQDGRTG